MALTYSTTANIRVMSVPASDPTSSGTLFKLVIFSLSLGMAPLATYFGSLRYVFDGNSTFAAISAVVAANVVLVAYILTSVAEDRRVLVTETPLESKKDK